ncbi:DUF6731 family protein [Clostridium sp. WILCCON 0269]|uniref:DUF6731 family protein n=1 Tax=Candidatus Clostridium eludens TaxID=3381663 RepID=A0ABW8SG30_9CLOT
MLKKEKNTVKTVNKNIRFNYFESMLVVDEEILSKVIKTKVIIQKIKDRGGKKLTKKQKEILKQEEEILEQEKTYNKYKATPWDMKSMLEYFSYSGIYTSIDIGGIVVEIEPGTFTPLKDDIISFQLTKMRDNMIPAKKQIGKVKQDIILTDDEYIGDFISILYDCKYSVLMIQSNNYGLSVNQIQAYFTLLRRRYIREAKIKGLIDELACELSILVDPSKAEKVLDAEYFKKIRIKGSDFMLDALLDPESEGLMGKTRRLIGERTGINFEVVLSVNTSKKTQSLDINEVEKLVNDFNNISDKEKRPIVEITKKDNDDSNVELVNLLHPRLTDVISFKIRARTSVGHEFLYQKMKENYINTRKVVARIISQL